MTNVGGSDAGRSDVGAFGGFEPATFGAADDPLTAYVIMRPADPTKRLDVAITSENVASLQPTADAVQRVTTLCAARGFDVGPFVGISFAITGSPDLFSRSFHAVQGGGLELDDADPSVAELIETVVMDEAAELFGATSEVETAADADTQIDGDVAIENDQ